MYFRMEEDRPVMGRMVQIGSPKSTIGADGNLFPSTSKKNSWQLIIPSKPLPALAALTRSP
jgi:hypothetical protein